MCICDIYMGLNMANCSGENLISASIGMSSHVEHLDLTNNDITTIDNDSFKDLRHLKTLLLNRNSINSIELDAFLGQSKLQTISLTYNRLEWFDNRIFEQNSHLTSVDLSGNKFMHLPNAPILRSASLQTLNLHKSQLTHLLVNYFVELPNIKHIDLSENLLIMLNLAAFATNKRLEQINVRQNRIKCDEQTEMSIVWLDRNNVDVSIDHCPKSAANDTIVQKFERMQMLPNTTPIPTTINSTMDLNKVWNTDNQNDHNIPILGERCRANETTVVHACHLFQVCVSNFTMLIEDVETKLHLKSDNMGVGYNSMHLHHTWFEFVTVQVAFYGGLLLGAMLGAVILLTMKLMSECVTMSDSENDRRPRNKRRNRRFVPSEIRDCNGNERMASVHSAQIERHGRREIEDIVSDRPSRPSTSFFAIFYERPVRRRYYRQFNRSATNLVRRLSQSRLFLNSSRAQNAAYRNNYTRRNQTDSTAVPESETMLANQNEIANVPLTQNEISDETERRYSSVHSLDISTESDQRAVENRRIAIRSVASESDLFSERSETPPPPYNVVTSIVHR